jgi:uncharacterized protein with PQ loop repeat
MRMQPHPASTERISPSDKAMKQVLGGLSVFTLVMTVPQILEIWINRQAAGVSLLSWGAYWLSALVWFWYGVHKHDRNIYLPCVGWLLLDSAVIAGAVIYG